MSVVGHMFSSDAYSDYTVLGIFQYPSLVWVKERIAEWTAIAEQVCVAEGGDGSNWEYCVDHKDFVDWLLKFYPDEFKSIEYEEIYLGSYGRFDGVDLK